MLEHCRVEEVLTDKEKKVIGVRTNRGTFDTGCYVDATGIWCGTTLVSRAPSRRVVITAHPATYTYLSTKHLPEKDINNKTPSTLLMLFFEESCSSANKN
ncbi:unnamed protein product [Gongylonema pulchrum]|uniref:DAO domain-containing protein n=1 Tax=Gongylonema pulchrum TaxID=637853 RepID=A0A183DHN2_9BILA|nr:unnamed protein product [Gongylonema pulchrum]